MSCESNKKLHVMFGIVVLITLYLIISTELHEVEDEKVAIKANIAHSTMAHSILKLQEEVDKCNYNVKGALLQKSKR